MQVRWTQHLNDKEAENFKKEVLSAKRVLERLSSICDDMASEIETSDTDYDSPNWAYRQAHNNGYKQCLQRIKLLADLDQRIIRLK